MGFGCCDKSAYPHHTPCLILRLIDSRVCRASHHGCCLRPPRLRCSTPFPPTGATQGHASDDRNVEIFRFIQPAPNGTANLHDVTNYFLTTPPDARISKAPFGNAAAIITMSAHAQGTYVPQMHSHGGHASGCALSNQNARKTKSMPFAFTAGYWRQVTSDMNIRDGADTSQIQFTLMETCISLAMLRHVQYSEHLT
ncbi:hypothetical protein CI102_13959 [Trichoderma harzianum]|nr:hypothetical protein CI102_13959 [Trichoderma harzianum]